MGIIHIFNPEHDLALAYGKEGFTPPAAAMSMRKGLGFIPAFWATEGDMVLVDDVEVAEREARRFACHLPKVVFCEGKHLGLLARGWQGQLQVEPWGWDASLRHTLLKAGFDEELLPSKEQVDKVRKLSHRNSTVALLDCLVRDLPATIGERKEARSMEEAWQWMERWGRAVVKAPWSSSGRGVRFVENLEDPNLASFVRNVILRQGSIIVEPLYDKVMDFAMEFHAYGGKKAVFAGLSLFHTNRGAYLGNSLAPEEEKWGVLRRETGSDDVLALVPALESLLGRMCDTYTGPIGVDMMVVEKEGTRYVHPCGEVNVRRTMGMAAISVAKRTKGCFKTMAVECRNVECRLVLT